MEDKKVNQGNKFDRLKEIEEALQKVKTDIKSDETFICFAQVEGLIFRTLKGNPTNMAAVLADFCIPDPDNAHGIEKDIFAVLLSAVMVAAEENKRNRYILEQAIKRWQSRWQSEKQGAKIIKDINLN